MLSMNAGTAVVLGVLVVIVALVVFGMIRKKKNGKGGCGCGCSGCPMGSSCPSAQQNNDEK